MSRKILFVVPYPINKAPSQRLKFEQYYSSFQSAGFEVSHASFMDDRMWGIVYKKGRVISKIALTLLGYCRRLILLFSLHKYDIVYIHLWVTPFGYPIFEWLFSKFAKKVIYDIDDLVFLKNIKHENRAIAILKGKGKPLFLMKKSNYVITCTPYLDKIAQTYNKNTLDISSSINTTSYIPLNRYKNDHELVLGWSGSHSTSQYLYLLKDVLLELRKELPFKLLVMGDSSFNIEGLEVDAIDWAESWEIEVLQRIDIGLYPLPENEEWVLGKSGLKALQYMALGIPTVATNVGCNDRVIEDRVSGFLVNGKEEWFSVLKELTSSVDLRESVGKKARLRVEEKFSLNVTAEQYLKVIENVYIR